MASTTSNRSFPGQRPGLPRANPPFPKPFDEPIRRLWYCDWGDAAAVSQGYVKRLYVHIWRRMVATASQGFEEDFERVEGRKREEERGL